jgi:hypothetical protein
LSDPQKYEVDDHEVAYGLDDLATAWGLYPQSRRRKIKQYLPSTDHWRKCTKWGGEYECPRCIADRELRERGFAPDKDEKSDAVRADALYREKRYKNFVQGRILRELGASHIEHCPDFDDLESKVWMTILNKIGALKARIAFIKEDDVVLLDLQNKLEIQSWLRTVVHSVVMDNFNFQNAKKRDVRRETSLPEDVGNRGIPDSNGTGACGLPAKPTGVRDDNQGDATAYLASLPQPTWDALN